MDEYHLIGAGGIGMSALARLLLERGRRVFGSDQRNSQLLEQLREIGLQEGPPPGGAQVVHSTAVPSSDPELAAAARRGESIWHRSDLLAHLMEGQRALTVTGSHGKTTCSSLLAHTLQEVGLEPSFALGGLLKGVNGRHGRGDLFVAEADESDGTMVKYRSSIGLLTGIEAEHMDHYGSEDRLLQAFTTYIERCEQLVWCADDAALQEIRPKGLSYGFDASSDVRITSFEQRGFSIWLSIDGSLPFAVPMIGRHNAQNAAGVYAVCRLLGVEERSIQQAMASFPGVGRRCEVRGCLRGALVIDDYAHHPTEVAVTLEAIKKAGQGRQVIACLQPHRYSRLAAHMEEFAASLAAADEIFITDVYSAGEEPIEEASRDRLVSMVDGAIAVDRADLVEKVGSQVRPHDIVVMMGAGDITQLAGDLVDHLQEEPPRRYQLTLLCGGRSCEHDVSLISASSIADHISEEYYDAAIVAVGRGGDFDFEEVVESEVVFPVFHGPHGEDGTFAALCEALGKPYVGPDHRGSSVAMDKGMTKRLALSHGIPTPAFVEFDRQSEIACDLVYPLIVKPSHLGSSIGIERVEREDQLVAAVQRALKSDTRVVVEQMIEGRELEFAVLGEDEVAGPGEILTGGKIYDHKAKYGDNPMKTTARADLPQDLIDCGRALALKVYRALALEGLSRVDFFLDGEGRWWLNEVNPMPGFTSISLYPQMWEAEGLAYRDLLDRLVIYALERSRR